MMSSRVFARICSALALGAAACKLASPPREDAEVAKDAADVPMEGLEDAEIWDGEAQDANRLDAATLDAEGSKDGKAPESGDGAADAGTPEPLLRGVRPFLGETTGDTARANPRRPTFRWPAVADATRYELQVDDSCPTFGFAQCSFPSAEVDERQLPDPSFTPKEPLQVSSTPPVGRRYYWRHRACTGDACEAWSPVLYVDAGRQLRDLNGDGYSDVILGSDLETVAAHSLYRMNVRVFLGGRNPNAAADLEIPIDVNRAGSDFRTIAQIVMVGDLDADGFADFMVLDAGFDVYFDRAHTFLGGATLSAAMTTDQVGGGKNGRVLIHAAGDLDGNGTANAVYTDTGHYHPCARVLDINLEPVFTSEHTCAASAAGDLNGDGFADLLVSHAALQPGGPLSSLSFFSGGPDFDGKADWTLVLDDAPSGGVTGGADLNGDGYMDAIVGEEFATVRFGGSAAFAETSLVLPAKRLFGAPDDFDGDGYADVLVGTDSEVLLFLGGPSMDAIPDLIIHGEVAAFAGDVDGDGRADLVVSNQPPNPSGAALYLGSSPPDGTADVSYTDPTGAAPPGRLLGTRW